MSASEAEFEKRDERSVRFWSFAGSLLLHAALIALLFELWQPSIPIEPPVEVVTVVPDSQGAEGAAGGGGGKAKEAASASAAPAATSEPPPETPAPAQESAPTIVPAVPPPETTAPAPQAVPTPTPAPTAVAEVPLPPPPPHPQRKPAKAAASAEAPPQPASTPPSPSPPAPVTAATPAPQAMAEATAEPTVSAAPPGPTPAATSGPGSGPGTKAGPGEGVQGTGAGFAGDLSGAGDEWFDRVRRHLRRFMQNPNEGREKPSFGTVWLSITVARDGTVLDAEVDKSSGVDYLDQSALQMVHAASPLPPVPASIPNAPVRFKIPAEYEPGLFERLFH